MINQHDNLAGDGLGTTDVANAFTGLGLDVDAVERQLEQTGKAFTDDRLDRAELGLLGEENDIDVDKGEPSLVQSVESVLEKQPRIRSLPAWIRVGEGVTDVPQGGGSEQSIGKGMEHDIRIRMASEAARVVDGDAAQDQGPVLLKAVCVMTNAHAHGGLLPGGRRGRLYRRAGETDNAGFQRTKGEASPEMDGALWRDAGD